MRMTYHLMLFTPIDTRGRSFSLISLPTEVDILAQTSIELWCESHTQERVYDRLYVHYIDLQYS